MYIYIYYMRIYCRILHVGDAIGVMCSSVSIGFVQVQSTMWYYFYI